MPAHSKKEPVEPHFDGGWPNFTKKWTHTTRWMMSQKQNLHCMSFSCQWMMPPCRHCVLCAQRNVKKVRKTAATDARGRGVQNCLKRPVDVRSRMCQECQHCIPKIAPGIIFVTQVTQRPSSQQREWILQISKFCSQRLNRCSIHTHLAPTNVEIHIALVKNTEEEDHEWFQPMPVLDWHWFGQGQHAITGQLLDRKFLQSLAVVWKAPFARSTQKRLDSGTHMLPEDKLMEYVGATLLQCPQLTNAACAMDGWKIATQKASPNL